MSYRLQTSDLEPDVFHAGFLDYATKGSDGVVAGVLDEIGLSYEADRLILGRGKLIVSGYPVLFEGKEVVGISSELTDGSFMLVGVLNVSKGRAKSFYLSVRDSGEVKQDNVLGLGEGVYEVKIAEFTLVDGKINNAISTLERIISAEQEKVEIEGNIEEAIATSNQNAQKISELEVKLGDLETDSERSFARALDGTASGQIFLTDSQEGYFSDFAILGKNLQQGSEIYPVTGVIPIYVRGKNRFAGKKLTFSSTASTTQDSIYYESLDSKEKTDDAKFIVCGKKTNAGVSVDNSNGLFQIRIRGLTAYYKHTISFDATLDKEWAEGNVNSVLHLSVVQGTKSVLSAKEIALTLGEKKHFSFTFTTDIGLALFSFNLFGLGVTFENIQIERSASETSYEEYQGAEYTLKIQDKNGVTHDICGVGNVSDCVQMKDGKPVLIKRTAITKSSVSDALAGSQYLTLNGTKVTENGEITLETGERAAYVLKEPQIIELDENVIALDKIKTYSPRTEIVSLVSILPSYNVKYGRNLTSVIKNIEAMLATI